jgi:uncharacterized membrane protein
VWVDAASMTRVMSATMSMMVVMWKYWIIWIIMIRYVVMAVIEWVPPAVVIPVVIV